jgi:hypothetical protein
MAITDCKQINFDEVFQWIDLVGERWMDGFDSGKYIYSDSSDLYSWSAYTTVSGGLSGFVRHGTVLKQS